MVRLQESLSEPQCWYAIRSCVYFCFSRLVKVAIVVVAIIGGVMMHRKNQRFVEAMSPRTEFTRM